jgi:hypothetical protein
MLDALGGISMAELQYAIDDRNQLNKDANRSLDKNLSSSEKVKVIIQGLSDSAIIGTDTRCFVFKIGQVGGSSFGSKLIPWYYADLNGVQLETGVHSGVVSLQGPGTTSKNMSYWNDRKDSPAASPYELSITPELYEQAREGVTILRTLIAKAQQSKGIKIPS